MSRLARYFPLLTWLGRVYRYDLTLAGKTLVAGLLVCSPWLREPQSVMAQTFFALGTLAVVAGVTGQLSRPHVEVSLSRFRSVDCGEGFPLTVGHFDSIPVWLVFFDSPL